MVVLRGAEGRAVLMLTAEAVTPKALGSLGRISGSKPALAITSRRASVLGLHHPKSGVAVLSTEGRQDFDAPMIVSLSNPVSKSNTEERHDLLSSLRVTEVERFSCYSAAVLLTKQARLLPAAVVALINDPLANDVTAWAARHNIFETDAGDVFQHEKTVARTLGAVSEARVPLEGAENTKIIAFRPLDGGLEHLAIVIGDPAPQEPVLTRLHSECFTGDLLASLKCDCGDQLRGAIAEIAAARAGILLYLAQEGRGIGLVNKLRAYELQEQGFDTLDANEQLGFDADERVYLPAVQMLKSLGFHRIRLMTNNPEKLTAMANCGIDVVERVQHAFASNKHNELYLDTKSRRSGHLF